jgi:hypothetical protein
MSIEPKNSVDLLGLLASGLEAAEGAQVVMEAWCSEGREPGVNDNYCRLIDWIKEVRQAIACIKGKRNTCPGCGGPGATMPKLTSDPPVSSIRLLDCMRYHLSAAKDLRSRAAQFDEGCPTMERLSKRHGSWASAIHRVLANEKVRHGGGWQCPKCFIISGAMWSGKPDPEKAPRCCGGEYMVPYSIPRPNDKVSDDAAQDSRLQP